MDTNDSSEYKRMRAVGKSISQQLEPKMSAAECGRRLGISTPAVLKIEQLALAKLAARLQAMARQKQPA